MPVRKDDDGNRSIEVEVDVPGTPGEVWRAIATGKGISSWFVPTTVEEHEGGTTVNCFGPGMDAPSTITKWNPPQSFVAESEQEGLGKIATEWIVEARSGGTCAVRVVHRWFADTDDWDAQFEGHAYGWAASFFRILAMYLEDFAGEDCSTFQLTAFSRSSGPETWRTIKSALRFDAGSERVTSAAHAPELAGTAVRLEVSDPDLLRARETVPHIAAAFEGMEGENPELILRLEHPAPGFAHVFIMPLGGPTMVSVRFHLFGVHVGELAAKYEEAWRGWLDQNFPAPVGEETA